jgi:hypothetical protein
MFKGKICVVVDKYGQTKIETKREVSSGVYELRVCQDQRVYRKRNGILSDEFVATVNDIGMILTKE